MSMKLCVVTGTRAEYGILKPLIGKLVSHSDFDLQLVVTGSHLASQYGNTYQEIEEDGFQIAAKIPILSEDREDQAVSKIMANALNGFDDYYENHRPDAVLLLGDRYEIFAAATAAYNAKIPIVHLYGGDTTEGALDEAYRHAITKMSYLHLVSNASSEKRVIQLGEHPNRVFNVGSLGVENALHVPLMPVNELEKDLGINPEHGYAVVTFHPVTLEQNTALCQCMELMKAMETRDDLYYIVTKSNADCGGAEINALWDEYGRTHSNVYVTESLGMRRYLSAVAHSRMVIGNSSSGLYEVPAFHIPTVNIGDRQKGRLRGATVIDCEPTRDSIVEAMLHAEDGSFLQSIKNVDSIYGDGKTSDRIIRILEEQMVQKKPDIKKSFYDL